MPDMLVPFDWEEAKRYFTAEAAHLLSVLARRGERSMADGDLNDRAFKELGHVTE
jgi:hypothetical protein